MEYAAIAIAIQIATLGWRINREILLGDAGRRNWFPIADCANVLSLLSIILFCVILPLNGVKVSQVPVTVLSIGFILIAMYPINVIGHYRFMGRFGRSIYTSDGKDYPYVTDHEWFTLSVTGLLILAYLVVVLR